MHWKTAGEVEDHAADAGFYEGTDFEELYADCAGLGVLEVCSL